MAGDLVYYSIPVPDAERAKAFYGEVLGWEFGPGNVSDGFQVTNTTPQAGIGGGVEASHPKVYLQVPDLDAAMAKVKELGGEVTGNPESIGPGRYVECRDDQGTSFHIWEAKEG